MFRRLLQQTHVVAAHALVVDDHSQRVVALRVPPSLQRLPVTASLARHNIRSALVTTREKIHMPLEKPALVHFQLTEVNDGSEGLEQLVALLSVRSVERIQDNVDA